MTYKFNYNSAELYISKYNTYGSRFFILADIENNTMFTGWTTSTVATPLRANYFVLENTTTKEVKQIYEHKKALGYVELNPDEFKEALKNARV